RSTIRWAFYTTYDGDGGNAHQIDLAGTVLTGRSLRSGPSRLIKSWPASATLDRPRGAIPVVPLAYERRAGPNDFHGVGWDTVRHVHIAFPISGGVDGSTDPPTDAPADMAFLVMTDWECHVGGYVRDLEIELR